MKEPLPTARLLPSGDVPSPFGLHLVLGPLAGGSEEGPVPLPLSTDEGTSRVYLGALRDADSVIELVAVKSAERPLRFARRERLAADEPDAPCALHFGARTASVAPGRSPWFPRLLQPDGGPEAVLPGASLRQALPVVLRPTVPDLRQAARAPRRRELPRGVPAAVVPRNAAPARRLPRVRHDRPRHRRLLLYLPLASEAENRWGGRKTSSRGLPGRSSATWTRPR